ncbi:MAG: M1 family metallopeptidase [Bacteroidales bacterium]|nr:M1 family metallopeptidase [Bacteroidales bacterium]
MKTQLYLITTIIIFANFNLFAQNYFHQEVNYNIRVSLNDIKHELSAFETIEYINNSPDNLDFIYFHLWPNAYDNNKTALAKQILEDKYGKLFENEELRGYIDSLDFKVNGKTIKWEYDKKNIDICKLYLNTSVKTGEKIIITTPFHVKLPKGVTSRLGHVGQSYQITQWYPKPAVYDKFGWHQMPYLNQGEFYSEFGSFDISITLPENYIVGATGNLQNQEEINRLNELAEKTAKIDSFNKKDASFPESSEKLKTIRFIQHNVHDFAWFADKRFHVLKGEVKLPGSEQKVTTWAMFPNKNADLWKKSLEYINDAVYFYSEKYGNYPYKHCTAVHSSLSAGGGMEYPNITVIGNSRNARSLEMVIMHEVGHNWFYGILGFNERKFTWQDEGINSFSEARYMKEKYGKDDVFYHLAGIPKNTAEFFDIENLRYKTFQELAYLVSARMNIDQQASISAEKFSNMNYGTINYMKVARIFDYLSTYLGKDKFDKIMHKFYNDWKFKHPYPEDIQNIFETETEDDLSWVFDDLLKTTKKVDYKIIKAKNNKITLKNIGKINSPVLLNGIKNDSIISSQWFSGFSGKKTFDFNSSVDKVVVDAELNMLELYRKNNIYKTKGIFRKFEPLRFKFFGILENSEKTQINFIPAVGWNNYNKFMLGAIFYNSVLPKNKFEYQIMPMYAFGSQNIAGSANFAYTFYPYNNFIQSLKFSVSGKQYAFSENLFENNFQKVKPEVKILFKNKTGRSKVKNIIVLNTIFASNPEYMFVLDAEQFNQYLNFNFSHINNRSFSPYIFEFNSTFSNMFGKASVTANYKVKYTKNKAVDFRLFAGTFLYKEDNLNNVYHFNLSGISGQNDYMYEEVFLGRYEPVNNSFAGSQFVASDGAFVTYSPFGNTDNYLLSLNISSDLPYLPKIIPLKLFFNIAYFSEAEIVPSRFVLDNFAWESGVKLSLFRKNVEVYLPLLMSERLIDINDVMTDTYFERIRFTFNLNNLNPIKILDKNMM